MHEDSRVQGQPPPGTRRFALKNSIPIVNRAWLTTSLSLGVRQPEPSFAVATSPRSNPQAAAPGAPAATTAAAVQSAQGGPSGKGAGGRLGSGAGSSPCARAPTPPMGGQPDGLRGYCPASASPSQSPQQQQPQQQAGVRGGAGKGNVATRSRPMSAPGPAQHLPAAQVPRQGLAGSLLSSMRQVPSKLVPARSLLSARAPPPSAAGPVQPMLSAPGRARSSPAPSCSSKAESALRSLRGRTWDRPASAPGASPAHAPSSRPTDGAPAAASATTAAAAAAAAAARAGGALVAAGRLSTHALSGRPSPASSEAAAEPRHTPAVQLSLLELRRRRSPTGGDPVGRGAAVGRRCVGGVAGKLSLSNGAVSDLEEEEEEEHGVQRQGQGQGARCVCERERGIVGERWSVFASKCVCVCVCA